MYNFLNVLYEGLKFIAMVVCVFVAIALFVVICDRGAREIDKRNCYEVYATDGVVLKKCKKFFEEEK